MKRHIDYKNMVAALSKGIPVAVACLTMFSMAAAQSISEGVEVLPGTGSGNEVFITQETDPAIGPLNSALIEILGDDNVLGGWTALGQFSWAFDGGTELGQTSGQFGSDNVFESIQTGSNNVIGFLQGVSATEAGTFSLSIAEIGAYGLVSENAYGDDVDHSALAVADDVGGRMNDWLIVGVPSDASTAAIMQTGNLNLVSALQLGSGNTVDLMQSGNGNELWATQCTDDSMVIIDQVNGDDNIAVVNQIGDGTGAAFIADAAVFQDGSGNTSVITQAAALGTISANAMINQTGDFNTASIYQAGSSGSGDMMEIDQTGNSNTGMISVYGISNDCEIVQMGDTIWANVDLGGDDNVATVDQSDDGAYASVDLSGDSNSVKIKQQSNSTPILLTLTGHNNKVKITQK